MLIDLMATQAKQRHLDIRDMAEAGHCAVCCRAAWAMLSVRRGSQHNADHSLCRPQNKTLVLRRNLSHSQCLVLSMNCNKQSDTVYNVLSYIFTLISALSVYWSCVTEEAWEHLCTLKLPSMDALYIGAVLRSPVPVCLSHTVQFSLNFAEVLMEL